MQTQTNKRSPRFFMQLLFIGLFGIGFLALMHLVSSCVLGPVQSVCHRSVLLTIGLCLVSFLVIITFIWLEFFKINVFQKPNRLTPLRFWLLLSFCAIGILGSSYAHMMFQAPDLLPESDLIPGIVNDGCCLFFFWIHLIAFFNLIRVCLKRQ